MNKKDTLYRDNAPISPFQFNDKVAQVFPDMIQRSVPGYPLAISMMSTIASQFVVDNSVVYDLGCSLGAVSLAIQQGIKQKGFHIIAVDNSQAMLDACRQTLEQENKTSLEQTNVTLVHDDIANIEFSNASMVVMNFTLQFIPVEKRSELLQRIYKGLLPGGVMVLSEKIVFNDDKENKQMQDLHLTMKKLNGYDDMEIAGKRQALEQVLMPETIETHETRLQEAGFQQISRWLQCLNFISLLAIK